MRTKHLFVLIHIRNKGEVGTINTSNFFSDSSKAVVFVDPFCYLCFVSVMLS